MWMAFVIWILVTLLFIGIGISTWNSKKTTGFFTGVKPPKVKDIKAFNHAVAKIWFIYGILLGIMGIPFLWMDQNSTYGILVALLCMFLCLALIITYLIVESKYKEK